MFAMVVKKSRIINNLKILVSFFSDAASDCSYIAKMPLIDSLRRLFISISYCYSSDIFSDIMCRGDCCKLCLYHRASTIVKAFEMVGIFYLSKDRLWFYWSSTFRESVFTFPLKRLTKKCIMAFGQPRLCLVANIVAKK